jgi:uncharacterized protein
MIGDSYSEKCTMLQQLMQIYAKDNVMVAFSGGVDSSLLLKMAVMYAGGQEIKVYAVTADTELHALQDIQIAKQIAEELGAVHIVLKLRELEQAGIRNNPIDRCYRCKKYLFGRIKEKAEELEAFTVLEGTNADDMLAYRPGIKAVEELGIKSPLREAGFTKEEVRRLAKEYGISTADRPSAPCLATRFPYGEALEKEKLIRVEQGEQFLHSMGFYNVRLRAHGDIARLEVDEKDMEKLLENKKGIINYLKALGWQYITMDLEGFRSGSMDIHMN